MEAVDECVSWLFFEHYLQALLPTTRSEITCKREGHDCTMYSRPQWTKAVCLPYDISKARQEAKVSALHPLMEDLKCLSVILTSMTVGSHRGMPYALVMSSLRPRHREMRGRICLLKYCPLRWTCHIA